MVKSKKSRPVFNVKTAYLAAFIVIALLVIVQSVFDVMAFRRLAHNDDGRITQLISNAVDDASNPVPIDAQSGKVYISGAHLQLPAQPNEIGQVRYRYSAGTETYPAELNFTSNTLLGQAKAKLLAAQKVGPYNYSSDLKEVFGEVPHLQACSRGVHVTLGDLSGAGPELQDLGTKKLSDGRTVHFYKESGCSGELDQLAAYVKQVDSY